MARSFVLGAGGFIGNSLSNALIKAGREAVLVGPAPSSEISPQASAVLFGKLQNFSVLEPLVQPGDIFYYLISTMTPSNSTGSPSDFVANDLGLFLRFLEWVEQVPRARIVFASSGGTVYGNAKIVPTDELAPLQPISFYGALKIACEHHLNIFAAQGRLSSTIARLSNPYGPNQRLNRGQGLIPAVLQKVSGNERLDLVDHGRAIRDFVYVDDVVNAIIQCGEHKALVNQTVNVGSGVGASVYDVVRLVEQALQKSANVRLLPPRMGDVHASVLNIAKLYTLTGWRPQVSLKEGIELCAQAHRTESTHE